MDKGSFYILSPRMGGTLAEQTDDLQEQLCGLCNQGNHSLSTLLQARVYVSDAANQCNVLRQHKMVQQLTATGVCNFVEQPPLNGFKVSLLLWFLDAPVDVRKVYNDVDGQLAEIHSGAITYYYHTVRFGNENDDENSEKQTEKAFDKHVKVLAERGLTLKDNCQRTWIFVRDVDRNYSGVVKARNEVFAREGLTSDTHFIASTGIGGSSEAGSALVAVDFLSIDGLPKDAVGYLHATDYLNPTHEYGVAFERGTYLDLPDSGRCYLISGTASIDKHGECVHRGDVITQAGRLFLNIDKLLSSAGASLADACYYVVYLRDVADRSAVETYMRLRFPHVPYLLTEARVCRPEWLIEVECVAMKSVDN